MKETIRQFASRSRTVLVTGALIVACLSAAFPRFVVAKEDAKPAHVQLVVDSAPVTREPKSATSFAPVVKKVAPSVVKVFTTSTLKNPGGGQLPFDNPFFRRFFGEDEEGALPRRSPKRYGLGSGVIMTRDGYILSNNHVIENADEIKVAMAEGGQEYTAKLVGTDPKTDIAVLKIEASNLPFLAVADSDQLEVGDVVLAVGNPFDIGQTVTMGIISAMGRGNVGIDYEDFIQTDAAINPGNSGGALVDANGRLIGINTAILSRTGGNQGIGFAVPINLARNVMENIVEHGKVIRGFLGVNIQDVDPKLAKEFKLKDLTGALVADVTPGSPAAKGGIKPGDVILEFNGKPVKDSRHLKLQVGQTTPGSKVAVKVRRDDDIKKLDVTLKELADKQVAKSGKASAPEGDLLDGVTVADLTSASRQQFRIPREVNGALITDVNADSPSFEAGLRPGDVIEEIDRRPVENADQAVALSEKKGKSVLLRVWSRGGSHYVVVKSGSVG